MSRMHEMRLKHQNMSLAEKEVCNCDLCKGLNVDKGKKKSKTDSETLKQSFEKIERNSMK